MPRLPVRGKRQREAAFWISLLEDWQAWYEGRKSIYGVDPPSASEKVVGANVLDSAVLTWGRIRRQRYLTKLSLAADAFAGSIVLDIGSGPPPAAALAFEGCATLYALDPLHAEYVRAGFPLHYGDALYVNAPAENIPLLSASVDAVISVNALDHVDNLSAVAREVRRVLRRHGRFAVSVEYHAPRRLEPRELDDAAFLEAFGWVPNLRRVPIEIGGRGNRLGPAEQEVLWRNF